EYSLLAVLGFILGPAGAERLGQIIPEFEEPRVEHDEDAPDIARAFLIEEQQAFGRVEVLRRRAVSVAAEKFHRDEGVKEVGDAARMEAEFATQLLSREAAITQPGEHAEFDGGPQDFGRPERKSGLENGIGRMVLHGHGGRRYAAVPIAQWNSPVRTARDQEFSKTPCPSRYVRPDSPYRRWHHGKSCGKERS